MKKVFLLSILFCLHLALKAQKVYFIYLQSESAAPFYVKMAGKIHSSTAEGYLIIPKLTDSTYSIAIGQPGKQNEPRFTITISRGDRGFLIKNSGGEFSLFDLQTLALYNPISSEAATTQTVIRNDNFTKLLAKAADDTTLLSQPVIVQEKKAKSQEPIKQVVKEDVALKADTQNPSNTNSPVLIRNSSEEKNPPIINTDSVTFPAEDTIVVTISKKKEDAKLSTDDYKRSVITRKSESSTSEGFGLVFLDVLDEEIDTIELIIPNPKITLPDTTQKQPTETKQFLEITNEKENPKKDNEVIKKDAKQKSQCSALSTDDDFFKLRRDMASKSNDDDMIAQARKYFKNKCYRTEQIKYLSTLFLTDEGKYRFFDAAYLHVSDQDKFISLQSEIIDSYYLNRFKALIAN
jgi:hypothetical protein